MNSGEPRHGEFGLVTSPARAARSTEPASRVLRLAKRRPSWPSVTQYASTISTE